MELLSLLTVYYITVSRQTAVITWCWCSTGDAELSHQRSDHWVNLGLHIAFRLLQENQEETSEDEEEKSHRTLLQKSHHCCINANKKMIRKGENKVYIVKILITISHVTPLSHIMLLNPDVIFVCRNVCFLGDSQISNVQRVWKVMAHSMSQGVKFCFPFMLIWSFTWF